MELRSFVQRGLCAALVFLLPALAAAQPHDFTAVDDAVQTITAAGDVPGAVVLIGQGDEILYHRAFGWRTLVPDPRPMTLDTIFDVASLTKTVATATSVMILVEEGKLLLSDPVVRHVPEFGDDAEERGADEALDVPGAFHPIVDETQADGDGGKDEHAETDGGERPQDHRPPPGPVLHDYVSSNSGPKASQPIVT